MLGVPFNFCTCKNNFFSCTPMHSKLLKRQKLVLYDHRLRNILKAWYVDQSRTYRQVTRSIKRKRQKKNRITVWKTDPRRNKSDSSRTHKIGARGNQFAARNVRRSRNPVITLLATMTKIERIAVKAESRNAA